MPFPDIDPVALQIGPLVVRWYALAFISGLLAGWWYMLYLLRRGPDIMTKDEVSDFFTWAILGVVAGGRIGYVSFYMPGYFAQHPLEIFFLWQGGMSFHGGLLGVGVAILLFCRHRKLTFLGVADLVACAAPIGLGLGRTANFINAELYGRASDVPWAVIFPTGGDIARHPSQLYEAALEGIVLFVILFVLARVFHFRDRPGFLAGIFLIGYGFSRMFVELYREPDLHIGFLFFGTTMGQLLSLPLVMIGILFVARSMHVPARLDDSPR